MDRYLNKKYKLDRVENFDEFFSTEMGMNSVMRAIAKKFTTVVQLTKKGDQYSLKSTIMFFTTSQDFLSGEEKDVVTADKRKIKNIFTFEGDNKLIEKQIEDSGRTMTIIREYSDEEMIVTATFGGVVCTSWCKLVRD